VRRIEAVTGDAAVAYTLERDKLLKDLAARLRVSSTSCRSASRR